MINVLQILSLWPSYCGRIKENSYYTATQEEIKEACIRGIEGIQPSEVEPILEFLTLRNEDVIRIIDRGGDYVVCDDLPVWERWKRYSRYNLRPLIMIGDQYYFGPHSARKSGLIWSNIISAQSLPANIRSPAVMRVIRGIKKDVEDALVDKTFEILKRQTPYIERNVRLHDRDKKGNHPRRLGDYDILAFWPDKNFILNIEDKDILPAFCLKDAKRVREKIFGRIGKNKGYLEKVEKRAEYLSGHLSEIAGLLGWDIDLQNLPAIISIFVSQHSYWWTRFPPRSTEVHFVRIGLLDKFICNL